MRVVFLIKEYDTFVIEHERFLDMPRHDTLCRAVFSIENVTQGNSSVTATATFTNRLFLLYKKSLIINIRSEIYNFIFKNRLAVNTAVTSVSVSLPSKITYEFTRKK